MRASKRGTPTWKSLFYHYWLLDRQYTDLLHIITSTADELSGGTNIDDLEPQKLRFLVNF